MSGLRPYQQEVVDRTREAIRSGYRRMILQLPTGAGKTVIAREIIRSAHERGNRALFVAPRRQLVWQASAKLRDAGIRHGVQMAGEPEAAHHPVQVASIWTLYQRAIRRQTRMLPEARVLIVDEAHLSLSPAMRQVIENYDGIVIGLTATPARQDGRGLGDLYETMVVGPTIPELVEGGYLVPVRYFAPHKPDLQGVKVDRGDYVESQLAARMDRPQLVGDVVEQYMQHGEGRQAVVFATGVAHSRHLRDAFNGSDIPAEHIDGETPTDERKETLSRLRSGETRILTNCSVVDLGWDEPCISCAIMARPTKSLVKYMQSIGRVLRPHPGKHDALVLDHAGSVDELGFVDEPIEWTLDETVKAEKKEREPTRNEPKIITCDNCSFVYQRAQKCPNCGYQPPKKSEPVDTEQGELFEIDRRRRRKNREWSYEEKRKFLGELRKLAQMRGYKDGWAAHKYKEKFGVWPNDPRVKGAEPVRPSEQTVRWVKSRMIAWRKRQEKEATNG